jgi:phosphatidylserine/phosphatidylglycerophosphate/cardiolipin synthase-like enzyme/DNA/RNA endonuclease YhcR with UshA esterase domain
MSSKTLFSRFLMLMAFLAIGTQAFAQISISAARALPTGSTVTVKGIVTNGNELGVIRYMQDATGGIPAYSSTMTNVQRGDSITVTGVTKLWSGLLEIDPVSSFTVHSTGNPSPTPLPIATNGMNTSNEGELVQMNNVQFQNAGGSFAGNTNYNVIGGGFTAQVRVNIASNLVGKPIPVGQVNVIGLSSIYNTTYQLLLRDTADIIPLAAIFMSSPVTQTNISTTGFSLNWNTSVAGSTQLRYGLTPNLELGILTGTPNTSSHSVSITNAQPAQVYYAQAFSVHGNDTAFSGVRAYATQSLSSGSIKVYFTRTVDTSVASYQQAYQADDALDDTLIAYIDRATKSIDMAIYNFNVAGISNIAAALNAAHARGVRVRVIHNGNTANLAIAQLSGIYSLASPTSAAYGIMHNKFVVFDVNHSDPLKPHVWTGSMNFHADEIHHYANNVLILQDQTLAKAYTIEFEEMWGDTGLIPNANNARFGPDKRDNTPHEFIIGGRRIESYFSPSDGVNEVIKNCIGTTNHELMIETMLITRSDIGYAISDIDDLGIPVHVIVNDTGECTPTVNGTLMSALGSNYREYGESYILHNKLMAADYNHPASDPLVLTGSHNWSNAADQRNDENTLVIHDSIIPNLYYQEHMARWALAIPVTSSIEDLPKEGGSLRIYPNPSEGKASIVLGQPLTGSLRITAFDLSGRMVYENDVYADGSGEISISLPTLNPGLYLIKLEAEGFSAGSRLMINRP